MLLMTLVIPCTYLVVFISIYYVFGPDCYGLLYCVVVSLELHLS